MQQSLITKIRAYLPEINVNEITLDNRNNPSSYQNDLNLFTQSVQNWSTATLEKAKLPVVVNEAKALTAKYGTNSDEGCALQMIIELDAVNKSIVNQDAATAALASMKLLEAVWNSSMFRTNTKSSEQSKNVSAASTSDKVAENSQDQNIQLYQSTINDLRNKYPHCNVNALRLLAATRLDVSKQELDDLDISPQ